MHAGGADEYLAGAVYGDYGTGASVGVDCCGTAGKRFAEPANLGMGDSGRGRHLHLLFCAEVQQRNRRQALYVCSEGNEEEVTRVGDVEGSALKLPAGN